MKIIIDNAVKSEYFTTIFQHIRNFTDFINILFRPDGMHIQTMDNAHVSILELSMPKEWFSIYECDEDQTLGINVSILHKILATKDKSQILNIVYDTDADSDKLQLHFTNTVASLVNETDTDISAKKPPKKHLLADTKTYDTHFEIPLVDLEVEQMEIPQIEYQAEFALASTNFSNIVNQLKMFGDTMDIHCSEENIVLYSHCAESGKMSVEINIDDLTEFSINEGESLKLSFSLSYLHHICAFNKLTKEIDIKICNDYPLCASYLFGDGATMKFYLAPKVEDE
jgi:proliferating cell nuclear antigen